VGYPKVFDLYEFCSPELKQSLDIGREFERKLREEEDAKALVGAKEGDVEMNDESKEEEKV
jgi:hypothetical protein